MRRRLAAGSAAVNCRPRAFRCRGWPVGPRPMEDRNSSVADGRPGILAFVAIADISSLSRGPEWAARSAGNLHRVPCSWPMPAPRSHLAGKLHEKD